jgi:cellulose synthase/poly-beta-1,6-N-acetylglucosamine synthase-like glycosyltransferase
LSGKALSVVIPTFNRADALLECLAHLEKQTFKDFEVVVVDDGSTDSTSKQMERYLTGTPLAIRYVYEENGGPAKARNRGISLLRTPLCLMLGDDIFASPNLVEAHLRLHQKYANLEVVALGFTKWSTSGQVITPFMRWIDESSTQFSYKDLLAGGQANWKHFYTSNLSVKTELLRKFPFKESFPYAAMEDSELGYRIEKQFGLTLKFVAEAQADHLHPTTFRQACDRMVRVGYSCRLFYELWPEERPPSNLLKRTAKRVFIRNSMLLKLLMSVANVCSRVFCPNPFMLFALACHLEIGYQSQRDGNGKLIWQHTSI